MVFAIEPMICEGKYEVKILSNNWTVVTLDGKLAAAHYENTVVITDGGSRAAHTGGINMAKKDVIEAEGREEAAKRNVHS